MISKNHTKYECFLPSSQKVIVVGSYGSGKTEVCVNLAIFWACAEFNVQLADLDIVNTYFRSREARALMERYHIRVVAPENELSFSDLPVMLPEIKGMLYTSASNVVSLFDVGGDEVGARVLASVTRNLQKKAYELWQVINTRRPFTNTLNGCLAMKSSIEKTSGLRISGLVSNTHLMGETTAKVILEGWRLTREVAKHTKTPLVFVTASDGLANAPELEHVDVPILCVHRYMLPPWLRLQKTFAETNCRLQSAMQKGVE